MHYTKRIYKNFPLHFAGYEQEPNFVLYFINFNQEKIKEITLEFFGKQQTYPINSSESKITLVLDEDVNYIPKLFSVTTDKVYYLKDYPDYDTVTSPKAIHSLGPEKELYRRELKKKFNYHNVRCVYEDNEKYWHCVCGHTNFSISDKCEECGKEKSKLAEVRPSYASQAATRHQENQILSLFLALYISLYLVDIFVQMFTGDFLFTNYDKNTLFAVTNRFIVPVLIIAVVALKMVFNNKHIKVATDILKILFLLLILYLNILPIISFIGTAYNLTFLWSVDILIAILVIRSLVTVGQKVYNFSLLGTIIVFFFMSFFLYGVYKDLKITIHPEGVSLTVQEEGNQKKYEMPETLNNMKVFSVIFPHNKEYEMEELVVSNNASIVAFTSTATFKNLKVVEVKENNKVYYADNNVLYKDEKIILVPLAITEVTLNSDVVNAKAFYNHYSLKTVTILENVKVIEKSAFANATNLENINFAPNSSLKTIEEYAFKNTGITKIEIPISVENIEIGILDGCYALESYKTPFIGKKRENHDQFYSSSDIFVYHFGSVIHSQSEKIPQSLKYVEVYDIDRIHNTTFYNAWYVETIVLPEELLYMGRTSFYGCRSLQEFTVPNGVPEINEECFRNCYSLKTIVIPASVTNIEKNAFLNCDALTSVIYLGDKTNLTIDPIGNQKVIDLLN